jgi:DNA-binding transcriptional ArsR family regulator
MVKSVSATNQMAALGDATRRNIVEILSVRPNSVADIARQLPVSRPAVSQHLRVLKDAGLVTLRSEGTRNIYQLDPKGVAALRDHLDSLWETALEQFKTKVERSSPQRKERRR